MCKEIKSVQSFSSGTYIALVLNATVGLATTMTPGIAKDGERKILKLLAINRGVDTKENEVEKEAADLASGYHRKPNGTRNCSNGHLARPSNCRGEYLVRRNQDHDLGTTSLHCQTCSCRLLPVLADITNK